MKNFVLLFCIFFSALVYSQSFQSDIDQLMESAREALRESELIQKKMLEEMMGSAHIETFNDRASNYQWKKTPDGAVFEIPAPKDKQTDFDITIEGQTIRIVSQKSQESSQGAFHSFNSSASQVVLIPNDLDTSKPRFENKDGKVRIYFKKRKEASSAPENVI